MAKKIIAIEIPPTPKFIPSWTGSGDQDFYGHGPRVQVSTRIYQRQHNEIWAQVWMRAIETKEDWTEVESSADFLVYKQKNRIYRIISDRSSAITYTDSDHQDDHITLPENELVKKFICSGDRNGKEAGINTGVSVEFNPIKIEVESSSCHTKNVTVPDPPQFIPQHVRGDRDFFGNGPQVQVWTNIYIKNVFEIWGSIGMRARETKKDWTEARGQTNFLLYRNDKPIVSILSDSYSYLSYVDTSHTEDVFQMGMHELVKSFTCVGDTLGKESGFRTGVTVKYNQITIMEG